MNNPGFKFEYYSKTIKFNGHNIQSYVIGSGAQQVLSFPSFPHSGLYYLWFLNHYDLSKVRFYTFDLPGWIGYSDNIFNKTPFSIDRLMDLVKTFIDEFKLNKFNVLGYSYGTALSIKLVSEYPQKVDKVALISPVINSCGLNGIREIQAVNLAKLLGADMVLKWYLYKVWDHYQPIITQEGFPPSLLTIYKNMIDRANSKVILDSIYTLFHTDFSPYLESLKDKKLLVVNSRNESILFRHQAEILRRHFSNCKSDFISGSHEDFILRPKSDIVQEVVKFLIS